MISGMNRNGFAAPLIVLIVAAILVGGGIWYYETHKPTLYQSTVAQVPTSTPQGVTSTQSQASGQDVSSGTQTYVSKALGLSFEYWQDGTVVINESGTILTIAQPNTPPQDVIEVFKKDPQQAFQQAVEDLLSAQKLNCTVTLVSSSSEYMPPAFDQQARISDNSPNSNNCWSGSIDYDDNSDANFAYNSNYPDRFYFYDFGQAIWPEVTSAEGDNDDWRTTIQLMNFATNTDATSDIASGTLNYISYFKLSALIADATTTSDWKTYTDPTYGFTFNYPRELVACPTPDDNFQYLESVEEVSLTAVSDGGCGANNELGSVIFLHVATPKSIAAEQQESIDGAGGDWEYFTPFACEDNMTTSCNLYTWFGEGTPSKSFVFNGINTKGQKLRVEFDALFLGADDENFSNALDPYVNNASGTILISDGQFINIAQANGEPEDAAFVQILDSIAASFKLN